MLNKNEPDENNSMLNEKADETASLGSVDLSTVNTKVVVYKVLKRFIIIYLFFYALNLFLKNKGNWCFIKKITKTKLEITRSLLIEVKRVLVYLFSYYFIHCLNLFFIKDQRFTA